MIILNQIFVCFFCSIAVSVSILYLYLSRTLIFSEPITLYCFFFLNPIPRKRIPVYKQMITQFKMYHKTLPIEKTHRSATPNGQVLSRVISYSFYPINTPGKIKIKTHFTLVCHASFKKNLVEIFFPLFE